MNNIIKKFVITISTLSLILTLFKPVFADEITPYYNNTSTVSGSLNINSTGLTTIQYRYIGIPDVTTKAVITSYLEKKTLGLFWRRVDIGNTNDEWVDTINKSSYSGSRTHQLSSTGKYRVTIVYTIYGSGGSADEITKQYESTY